MFEGFPWNNFDMEKTAETKFDNLLFKRISKIHLNKFTVKHPQRKNKSNVS